MSVPSLWKSFKQSCGYYGLSSVEMIKANDIQTMRKKVARTYFFPRSEFTVEAAKAVTPKMLDSILSMLSARDLLNDVAYNGQSRRRAYDPDPASRGFMLLNTALSAGRYDLLPLFANYPIDYNTGDAYRHPVSGVMRSGMSGEEKIEWVTIMAASGLSMVDNKNEFGSIAREQKLPQLRDIMTRAGVYMGDTPLAALPAVAPPPTVETEKNVSTMKPIALRKP